eukprot:jgi/Botrbrau1/7669/Bobra.0159s0111.1
MGVLHALSPGIVPTCIYSRAATESSVSELTGTVLLHSQEARAGRDGTGINSRQNISLLISFLSGSLASTVSSTAYKAMVKELSQFGGKRLDAAKEASLVRVLKAAGQYSPRDDVTPPSESELMVTLCHPEVVQEIIVNGLSNPMLRDSAEQVLEICCAIFGDAFLAKLTPWQAWLECYSAEKASPGVPTLIPRGLQQVGSPPTRQQLQGLLRALFLHDGPSRKAAAQTLAAVAQKGLPP